MHINHIRFLTAPSRFEIDHARGVLSGLAHLETYHALPDTPIWHRLEARHDLAPARFDHFHPNIGRMIEEAAAYRLAATTVPTIDLGGKTPSLAASYTPTYRYPPDATIPLVPEPAACLLLAIGLVVAAGAAFMKGGDAAS